MRSLHVGHTLRVRLFRRGQTQEVTLILPERPLLPQDVLAQPSVAPLGELEPWEGPATARKLRGVRRRCERHPLPGMGG